MDLSNEVEGWGWPELSRKAHYFVGKRALCLKWLYAGPALRTQSVSDKRGPDDCAICHKRAQGRTPTSREGR